MNACFDPENISHTCPIMSKVSVTKLSHIHRKSKVMCIEFNHVYIGAQWLSGRVLEIEGLRVRASSASLCCVLEQDTLILEPRKAHPDISEKLLTGT